MTVVNRLDRTFERVRAEGRAALMPYVTGGFPSREGFVDLVSAILDAGADMLELGIPFSDPLLDGVSVQGSQQQALGAGTTPKDCLRFAEAIHARSGKPVILMGAYNPVLSYGVDSFCRDAAEAGASALIIPDVPFEEQGELLDGTSAHGLHLIQLLAPTSTDERLKRVCARASGFIYCISVAGVTGARASVAATARPLVERVHACTDVPAAVGFGIAGPEQAREVARFADGVIVGARLIEVIRDAAENGRADEVTAFIGSLRAALQHAEAASTGTCAAE
jgi:tryptophan synthase alpha chain